MPQHNSEQQSDIASRAQRECGETANQTRDTGLILGGCETALAAADQTQPFHTPWPQGRSLERWISVVPWEDYFKLYGCCMYSICACLCYWMIGLDRLCLVMSWGEFPADGIQLDSAKRRGSHD